jgi:hypothetical protein
MAVSTGHARDTGNGNWTGILNRRDRITMMTDPGKKSPYKAWGGVKFWERWGLILKVVHKMRSKNKKTWFEEICGLLNRKQLHNLRLPS